MWKWSSTCAYGSSSKEKLQLMVSSSGHYSLGQVIEELARSPPPSSTRMSGSGRRRLINSLRIVARASLADIYLWRLDHEAQL
jgi:hypothetical protein